MSRISTTVKAAVRDFVDDQCMVSGAALAYYTIFSLPPLLVLIFYIAGLFGVSEARINRLARNQLGLPIASIQPGSASSSSAGSPESADRTVVSKGPVSGLGPISKVIGVGILIFSATGLFAQLQFSLNRAWEVEPDPHQGGVRNFLGKRLVSLGMVLVIAFLLLVSLVLSATIQEILGFVQGRSPDSVTRVVGGLLNNLASLAVAVLLFAAMFKTLPDAEMRWKDLWVGALITALLFVIGKAAIGWYLQNSRLNASWPAAAASLIATLVWVYYTSLIVLLGAEITQVWANRFGEGIRPSPGAVRVVQEKRRVPSGAS